MCSRTWKKEFAEWQAGVVGGRMEVGATPGVGSKCVTTRRIGGGVGHRDAHDAARAGENDLRVGCGARIRIVVTPRAQVAALERFAHPVARLRVFSRIDDPNVARTKGTRSLDGERFD